METKGSQIFHKLHPTLTPKKLKRVLKEKHKTKVDGCNKNRKTFIHHPSPCSFACIDMVFLLSNNWSPYFAENVSIHLNKLTQLLVKTVVAYALFHTCDTFSLISLHEDELAKILLTQEDENKKNDARSKYIKAVAKKYVHLFSKLNIYKTLIKIRKSFENSVRWHIALGFVPLYIWNGKTLYQEMCSRASDLLVRCHGENDDIQTHLIALFTMFEYNLKTNEVLSPIAVKHNILISSQDGWYTATNYNGEDIELLSFDDLYPDSSSKKVSLAGSMLPHEYLYLFAHDEYAIQTTKKLSQSTIVVSSEPPPVNTTQQQTTMNEKKSLSDNVSALQEVQDLYMQMSDDGKKRLAFNPTTITMLDSELPNRNQVRVLKEMYQQLKDKALTKDGLYDGINSFEDGTSSLVKTSLFDINDDPKVNLQRSLETIQEVGNRSHIQQLEKKLREAVKTVNSLQSSLTKHIEKNAVDNLMISILKLEKDEKIKHVQETEKEIKKITKHNSDLQKQLDNMTGIVQDLTNRINVTQEENTNFMNLIMKGKTLKEDVEGDIDTTWVMTPEKRTEIVNLFLTMLNFGNNSKILENNTSMNVIQQYETVLIDMKIDIIPLFYSVRNKTHLDLCNSWVSSDIQDKLSSFSHCFEPENKPDENDKIQIHETASLKLIDINPVSVVHQERVNDVKRNTLTRSDITGPSQMVESIFTKKFFNIQFPQAGNIDVAVDKGVKEMWNQMIKTTFMLDPPMYTITGQEIVPGPSQGTYEKFIIPYLTFLVGCDDNIRETVALVMKLENKQMFEHGAKDINTFLFDEIFYFFWDNVL